ncbi:hypothetical protein F3J02_18090 [Acinetobacter sp. Tr-809]|uniref:hypothetical protein n=1 Tax=Acinetobacter TaxID=469 RepID=UPI001420DADA|nr:MULTISPECIES: hypothetical protein [Acinetobacter]MCH7390270.1 hypothetical protein [Acinetobacter dispersus]NIE98372.1 hypothetical protein [Acinetobacter sp. Tr-809]
MENKKFLIEKISTSEDIIFKANYIFFDPLLWMDAHYVLKQLGVKYELIGSNLFENESMTPTLVDLNLIDETLRRRLWEEIGSYFYVDAFSQFDQMSMFQNYILSKKNIYEMKDFLAKMMKVTIQKKNFLFRMFDSRAMIHFHLLFNFYNNEATSQIEKFQLWQDYIDEWTISIAGQYFTLSFPNHFSDQLYPKKFSFDDMMQITEKLRVLMTPNMDVVEGELGSTLPFEELLHREYKNILGEK